MSLIAELLRDLAGRLARLRSPPADPATGPAARPPGGEVHLGDLATALGTLHWQGPDQAQIIAGCLGLGLHAAAPPAPEPPRVYAHRRAPPPVYVPPAPRPPPALPEQAHPILLEALPDLAPADLDWSGGDAARLTEPATAPCARATLFPERTSRHLAAAALTTWRPGPAIDRPRLIAALARRAPPRTLPRRLEPTLARGCQVLLDYSATMVPFWPDLDDLGRQVANVVGTDATRLFGCDGDPLAAARWRPGHPAEPWRPDGSPLLAATDLGIQGCGGAHPHPGWDTLARACATAGGPLLILIPWPPARWPAHLPGRPVLIHWAPDTGAGLIRRALGPRRPVR